MDARWYDARKGRFIQSDQYNHANLILPKGAQSELLRYIGRSQADLLRDPAQQMRYGYVSGNALRWVDPLGLENIMTVSAGGVAPGGTALSLASSFKSTIVADTPSAVVTGSATFVASYAQSKDINSSAQKAVWAMGWSYASPISGNTLTKTVSNTYVGSLLGTAAVDGNSPLSISAQRDAVVASIASSVGYPVMNLIPESSPSLTQLLVAEVGFQTEELYASNIIDGFQNHYVLDNENEICYPVK